MAAIDKRTISPMLLVVQKVSFKELYKDGKHFI